jgi:hypothetical protein
MNPAKSMRRRQNGKPKAGANNFMSTRESSSSRATAAKL